MMVLTTVLVFLHTVALVWLYLQFCKLEQKSWSETPSHTKPDDAPRSKFTGEGPYRKAEFNYGPPPHESRSRITLETKIENLEMKLENFRRKPVFYKSRNTRGIGRLASQIDENREGLDHVKEQKTCTPRLNSFAGS